MEQDARREDGGGKILAISLLTSINVHVVITFSNKRIVGRN